MSTFFRRPNHGDDPEYDAYIESHIDPEWTGRDDSDPFGWMADRESDRAERQMDARWTA